MVEGSSALVLDPGQAFPRLASNTSGNCEARWGSAWKMLHSYLMSLPLATAA